MLKLTPILVVDAIEPSVPFWTERLGFTISGEVRGDDGRLRSIFLQKDGLAVNYRTVEGIRDDFPVSAGGQSVIALDVTHLEDFEQKFTGAEFVVPMRETSYGSAEFAVREPGGHLIIFTASAGY